MFLANSSRSEHVLRVHPARSLMPLQNQELRRNPVPGLSKEIASLVTSVPWHISSQARAYLWTGRTKRLRNMLQLLLPQP